ncbi:MAG: SDR family oxidoreductase [Verrucomicrobiota bacterium]|nr:SDR family oxidoreductase [Verrucomicrobiota bacterium]
MSFLNFENKTFLVLGLSNKRSVAYAIGKTLIAEGAKVVFTVHNEARKAEVARLVAGSVVLVCDVEDPAGCAKLAQEAAAYGPFNGLVHSIAFANYSAGLKPFHETARADFLQAVSISAFSLVEVARAFKPHLTTNASVVTIGISSQVTAANYGFMSPIKASLESCVRFLAKSFSADTEVRFNSVNAGPLKTKSSAGIPGYLENYLFAEKLTLRKRAVQTQEVADTAVYLLSERSSGINAQGIVVNAGMDWNYFDEEVVRLASRLDQGAKE